MSTTNRRMDLAADGYDQVAALFEADRRAQAIGDRALAKSMEQVALNNLPRQVRVGLDVEVWSVHSRTSGDVWLVTLDTNTGEIQCSCPANQCWHVTHVLRARRGEIGYHPLPISPRIGNLS